MPAKKYRIKLSPDERESLESIRDKGSHKAYKYKRAVALLMSDENAGASKTDAQITEVTGMHRSSIEKLRQRTHELGPLKVVEGLRPTAPPVASKITGDIEAHITQIACSPCPEGVSKWSLKLIAEKVVSLGLLKSISHTTVGNVLKKVSSNHGSKKDGVSHPKQMPIS